MFPTPSQINDQYQKILKSIKPSINTNDQNSDFVIRGKTFSGIVSGLYGDQDKVDKDSFVSSMRPESLALAGSDLGINKQPATQSIGVQVRIYGTNGIAIGVGSLTFLYTATNIMYTNTTGGTISGGFLDVEVLCDVAGQIGNVASPDVLTIVSPPANVTTIADIKKDITDGSDIESDDSYRARILSKKQNPPSGGNEIDYPRFAFEANPSVRSALIRRFGRGLGTVDVYITTGTTDIDTAITNGEPIIRIPSPTILNIVQQYYNQHVPLTDCPGVFAPTEVNVDIAVNVVLAQGLLLTSVPSDPVNNPLNLTVQQLIEREISRVLYKLPVGGRDVPGFTNGFVTAGDIEEGLDVWLSSVRDPISGTYEGKIPILADRQCQKLDSPNWNKALTESQLAAPGTLTVVLGL